MKTLTQITKEIEEIDGEYRTKDLEPFGQICWIKKEDVLKIINKYRKDL